MSYNASIPWVEKYRPQEFEHIVLDPLNKEILENIIKFSYFPNLLFYGPPGTGKTTTITNLVKEYQIKLGENHKGLMIHLNASDERGIDLIRNQIQQFVNSKSLFHEGMKFVILDEVDYMTKSAQQALRCLIMKYSQSVRFCLICNYISKVDEKLQNEFLKVRFNNLPQNHIISFLKNIINKENIELQDADVYSIQQIYSSDIRSMINYIQSRYDCNKILSKNNILNENNWIELYNLFANDNSSNNILHHIKNMSIKYQMTQKNIIKDFLNYIVRKKIHILTPKIILFVKDLLHTPHYNPSHFIIYFVTQLLHLIPKD